MAVFIYNSRKYKQICSDRKQISGCLEMGREMVLLQEWAPLPGPERVFLSNTGNWIVQGDRCGENAGELFGKGCLGREQEGEGTQEDYCVMWNTASGFMVMGLVSRLSAASHFDAGPFLVVHLLLSQRGCQTRRVLGGGRTHGVSFWPLPNSSSLCWLFSSMFLTRTSCHKVTHAAVTVVPSQGGWFQSACFP